MPRPTSLTLLTTLTLACTVLTACSTSTRSRYAHRPGAELQRTGDEIMVAGQLFHTGTRVVLWTDEHGYDAYRTEKRFGPIEQSSWAATTQPTDGSKRRPEFVTGTPNRYSTRNANLTPEQLEEVRGGGWTLPLLQDKVDQFVLHYDVAGVSKNCFKVLHDIRNLSVHFLLDVDGTLYQTLDLKERARHATKANDRSIGIEIANMGSYSLSESPAPLSQWYKKDENGLVMLTFPAWIGDPMILTPNFVGRPARNEMVVGEIRGRKQRQYDFTPEQYAALTKLTATLCTVFPKINCDYPRNPDGFLNTNTLTDEEWRNYQGVLGHYHVQTNKSDPGPAFQWDAVIDGARKLMGSQTLASR